MRMYCIFAAIIAVSLADVSLSAETPGQSAAWSAKIQPDFGHRWRPPFGLDRVGRPLGVVVEVSATEQPLPDLSLAGYRDGMEIGRHVLTLSGQPPKSRVEFDHWPSELVLFRQAGPDQVQELVRQKVDTPEFEAEALARPDDPVHPVDLGTILVPSDWLLLEGQQSGTIRFAALCRKPGVSRRLLKAWFASARESISSVELPLVTDQRAEATLPLPIPSAIGDRDVLHVSVESSSGDRLWQKEIPTMIVRQGPLAAIRRRSTKLRYDAPISVRAADGSLSSIPFEQGWGEQLQDVVVSLPNGTRFVFWRGSSYVPFWAGTFQ